MNCAPRPVVAVCLFGVIRNNSSLAPLGANLLRPLASAYGHVYTFVHAMLVPDPAGEIASLGACRWAAEDQDVVDVKLRASYIGDAAIGTYNEHTRDNIFRAAYSLQQVGRLVLAHEAWRAANYTLTAAVRLDTAVLSLLPLPLVGLAESGGLAVPAAHHYAGLNDRYAIGARDAMLHTYMQRLELIYRRGELEPALASLPPKRKLFMQNTETLLCSLLKKRRIPVALLAFLAFFSRQRLCHQLPWPCDIAPFPRRLQSRLRRPRRLAHPLLGNPQSGRYARRRTRRHRHFLHQRHHHCSWPPD